VQLCCSKRGSILSALLPELSVSGSKGAALSPQIAPGFLCWLPVLAAGVFAWQSLSPGRAF